jgi:hypothetical protein
MERYELCIDLPLSITDVKGYISRRAKVDVIGFSQIDFVTKVQDFSDKTKEQMFNHGNFNRYDVKFNSKRRINRKLLERKLSPCSIVYYFN